MLRLDFVAALEGRRLVAAAAAAAAVREARGQASDFFVVAQGLSRSVGYSARNVETHSALRAAARVGLAAKLATAVGEGSEQVALLAATGLGFATRSKVMPFSEKKHTSNERIND